MHLSHSNDAHILQATFTLFINSTTNDSTSTSVVCRHLNFSLPLRMSNIFLSSDANMSVTAAMKTFFVFPRVLKITGCITSQFFKLMTKCDKINLYSGFFYALTSFVVAQVVIEASVKMTLLAKEINRLCCLPSLVSPGN